MTRYRKIYLLLVLLCFTFITSHAFEIQFNPPFLAPYNCFYFTYNNELELLPAAPLEINCEVIAYKSSTSEDDGGAAVTYNGGTPPYTFSWSNGSSNDTISNLSSGTYTVTVTDADGSQESCSVEMKVVEPIANPDLVPSCHMDVIILMDESGSIKGSGSADDIRQEVKDAAYSMLQNFIGTSVRVRIVEFNRAARRAIVGGITDYQLVDAVSITDFYEYLYNNPNDGTADAFHYDPEDAGSMGWTNWEDVLNEVEQINVETNISPLVLFITDGVPTSYNNNNGGTTNGTGAAVTAAALSNAVGAANRVKEQGSHIFVVGVPNPNLPENNVIQVSDSDRYPDLESDYRKGDYAITDSDNIEQLMSAISAIICKADLSLTKTVDNGVVCSPGDTVTFTITLTNSGIETSPYAQVVDSIPSGYTYVGDSDTSNTNLIGDELYWDIDTLLADSSITLEIYAVVNNSGDYKNVAQVYSSALEDTDSEPNNDDGDQSEDDEDSATITLLGFQISTLSSDSISCSGYSDGEASVSVSGGSTPYSYLWSTGSTNTSISNLSSGWYTVQITDNNGCVVSDSVFVSEPAELTITLTQDSVDCYGQSTGSAFALPSGGSPTYTYAWSSGETTSSITNKPAGTYSVTVTDKNGCTASGRIDIEEPTELTIALTQDSVSCHGLSDGSAEVLPSGGSPAYTYAWSSGEPTSIITNKPVGTYSVTVTDKNGCTASGSIDIEEPAELTLTLTQDSVDCNGQSTGSAFAFPSGGSSVYSYAWSSGETTSSITNKKVGTYSVTVTDKNGCTASGSIDIEEPAELTLTLTSDSVDCNGQSTGSAVALPSGGSPAYSYVWSTGETTSSITNKPAGTYSVTVTDKNGCTASGSIDIEEPTELTLTLTQDSIDCYGQSTGSAVALPSGGSPTYTYAWSTGETTSSITNKKVGTYSVTVTDKNGCTASGSIDIEEPTELTLTLTQDSIDCYGQSTGSAVALPSGGSPTYTYAWSTGETTSSITNKPAGTYSVTVTDKNGCTASGSIDIEEPTELTITLTQDSISCQGQSDGSAEVEVSGGSHAYTYAWSSGETTSSITNKPAGTYSVMVTDKNGCTTSGSIDIKEPAELTLTLSSDSVDCHAQSTGSAEVLPLGGSPAYSYVWSSGETTSSITNKPAGTYSVTVTDKNGCTTNGSIDIEEPVELTITLTQDSISCQRQSDGAAEVLPFGGSPAYTYAWNSGETTSSITNKTAGTYSVTVTDKNGCTASGRIDIEEPAELTLTLSSDSVDCYGQSTGSAFALSSGGSPAYSYVWSSGETTSGITNKPAGMYSVMVTDKKGCTASGSVEVFEPDSFIISQSSTPILCYGDSTGAAFIDVAGSNGDYSYKWTPTGSPGDTSIQNIVAGEYRVEVEDALGCKEIAFIEVTQPDSLNLIMNSTKVTCFGGNNGTANAQVAGGKAPYTYMWSTGETTSNINNKPSGWYELMVTDDNGCTILDSVFINEPDSFKVDVDYKLTTCAGEDVELKVNVSGGIPPYLVLVNDLPIVENVLQHLPFVSEYSVYVKDQSNCGDHSQVINVEEYAIDTNALRLKINKKDFCRNDTAYITAFIDNVDYESLIWENIPDWSGLGPHPIIITQDTTIRATLLDSCGNNAKSSIFINYIEPPAFCDIIPDDTVCVPLVDVIRDECTDFDAYYYTNWYIDGEAVGTQIPNQLNLDINEPGEYWIKRIVTTYTECRYTFEDSGLYVVYPIPEVNFEVIDNVLDTKHPVLEVANFSTPDIDIAWQFGDGGVDSSSWEPTYEYEESGEYTVTLEGKNQFGCPAKKERPLKVEINHQVDIPTGFKPKGQGGQYVRGQNDVFYIIADHVDEIHIMVFNRWGEIVFESKDISIGWDGTYKGEMSQQDVYVYKIYLKFEDGFEFNETGSVTLLR